MDSILPREQGHWLPDKGEPLTFPSNNAEGKSSLLGLWFEEKWKGSAI